MRDCNYTEANQMWSVLPDRFKVMSSVVDDDFMGCEMLSLVVFEDVDEESISSVALSIYASSMEDWAMQLLDSKLFNESLTDEEKKGVLDGLSFWKQ